MTKVVELIDLIAQGKNVEANELLNTELLSRSYESIKDITPQVAQEYFAPVSGEEFEEDDEEVEYEDDEINPEEETDE